MKAEILNQLVEELKTSGKIFGAEYIRWNYHKDKRTIWSP